MDGANLSFVRALKDRVDEDTIYLHKKNYPRIQSAVLQQNMFVIPVQVS